MGSQIESDYAPMRRSRQEPFCALMGRVKKQGHSDCIEAARRKYSTRTQRQKDDSRASCGVRRSKHSDGSKDRGWGNYYFGYYVNSCPACFVVSVGQVDGISLNLNFTKELE